MNSTPKRFGNGSGAALAANAGSDSSHGSAMVTPAPASTLRRVIPWTDFFVLSGILSASHLGGFTYIRIRTSLVHELRTRDNCLHHPRETVAIRGQRGLHAVHRHVVGEHQ